MENNNQSITNCSSCHSLLPVDSRHRTCQACRERLAASRRRCRAEDQQEETDVATRPRGRPRTVESSDAESRPRGRPMAEAAAYISQLSRLCPLDLGRMDKKYPHFHALHWIDERQETSSLRNPSWESCCKRGSVQLQLLPNLPQYLKDLLASTDTQGRRFKNNLRQYSAAFAFSFLGRDIASVEDRANSNLDPEIIRELSVMLAQCNPFARVYRHAHEILSNHESDSNNDQTETNTPYTVISPSMRMHLIEGSDRRIQNLPQWKKLLQSSLLSIATEAFVTSFLS